MSKSLSSVPIRLVVIEASELSHLISQAVADALRQNQQQKAVSGPLSLIAAARRAKIRTAVLRAAVEDGSLPSSRTKRGHWLIAPAAVDAWVRVRR